MSKPRSRKKTTRKQKDSDVECPHLDVEDDSFECPHLGNIDTLNSNKKILNPTEWLCDICKSPESVWACLTCGYMGYVPIDKY